MRIIGGKYKGRKINPPANLDVRPTTDFAKEALFNILEHRMDLEETSVLELFAGTGNMTLEFASHGARVFAVEKEPRRVAFIKKSVENLGIENVIVIKQDVQRFLKGHGKSYDLVFADPPFDIKWLPEIPGMIFDSGVLKDTGTLILEHGPRTSFKDAEYFYELRKYGNVNFSLFSKSKTE